MKWALTLVVIVVIALHQDFWLWRNKSLVFGFLPIGLAYHIAYSILAAFTMSILVRSLWPVELEALEDAGGVASTGRDRS